MNKEENRKRDEIKFRMAIIPLSHAVLGIAL